MFRRRTSDTAGDANQVIEADLSATDVHVETGPRPGVTPKKGAPTPKRSDAEARRRQPYQAPSDRKEASKAQRTRDRSDRIKRSQALQRGEQWALPAKDRGPVRALARDYVDSRRGLGEYYMFIVVLLVVLLVIPGSTTKVIADGLVLLILAVIVGEGWLVGSKVNRLAMERYPGQSTRGLRMYVIMRGISMRKMRMPKPRVERGDKI